MVGGSLIFLETFGCDIVVSGIEITVWLIGVGVGLCHFVVVLVGGQRVEGLRVVHGSIQINISKA